MPGALGGCRGGPAAAPGRAREAIGQPGDPVRAGPWAPWGAGGGAHAARKALKGGPERLGNSKSSSGGSLPILEAYPKRPRSLKSMEN